MSIARTFLSSFAVVFVLASAAACSSTVEEPADSESSEEDLRIRPPTPRHCGGIAGLPCPKGQTCIDDPRDNCDPKQGGADCIGICVQRDPLPPVLTCANVKCTADTHCEETKEGPRCVPNEEEPADCRKTGCGTGQWCTMCWVGYACIPKGAVC